MQKRIFNASFAVFIILIMTGPKVDAQWKAMNKGLDGGMVRTLTQQGGYVLAVEYSSTLYRSVDDGLHWEDCTPADFSHQVNCVAATRNNLLVFSKGMWLSSDQGSHWTNVGLGDKAFLSMVVRGDSVWACSAIDGLYISSDQGSHWEHRANSGLVNSNLRSIALLGNYLVGYSYKSVGLCTSTDMGASWTSLPLTDFTIPSCLVLSSNGATLYCATSTGNAYYSLDSAQSWIQFDIPDPTTELSSHEGLLYGTGPIALLVSSDFGLSWQNLTSAIDAPGSMTYVWKADRLFIGTQQGIAVSADSGKHWETRVSGIQNVSVWTLCRDGDNMYAGTTGSSVFKSTNAGQSWTPLVTNKKFSLGSVTCIAFGDTVFFGTQRGMAASSDGGATWGLKLNGFFSTTYECFTRDSNMLYAGPGRSGDGVAVSSDFGVNWNVYNQGLATTVSPVDISAHGDTVIIADWNGPYCSLDKGQTWHAINHGIEGIQIQSLTRNGSDIWIATDTLGLYHSTDFGLTWLAMNNGIANTHMLRVRRSGNTIVAFANGYYDRNAGAQHYSDVYVSIDNGQHWKSILSDLSNGFWRNVELFGKDLYVGVYGHGIYHANLDDFDLNADVQSDNEAKVSQQSFPAVHDVLSLALISALHNHQDLLLYDQRGLLVQSWTAASLETQTALDLSALSFGVYVLRAGEQHTYFLKY